MTLSEDAQALWETATALARRPSAVSPGGAALPPLLFFTDPVRTPRPWETAERLPEGAGVVYRAFGAPDAREIGHRLRRATRAAGVRLLVGFDADLAQDLEADGLHLPERALTSAYALSGRRPDWLLTGAVHSSAAMRLGRDVHALVLSPVFPAGGASAQKPSLGLEEFAAIAGTAGRPVYALGGITPDNAAQLMATPACGLAGVDAIQRAFGPN